MRYLLIIAIVLGLASPGSADIGTSVRYRVNGMDYEGFFISPGEKAPFVLLLHDWDGLTSYEIKRARMLADRGYAVFAADLFGAGVRPTKLQDRREHTGELYRDRQKMRALMMGALNEARALGAETRNGVVAGYCFGGAAVLELARSGAEMKGFAVFHGGLQTPNGQDYSNTRSEILVMHGSSDTAVPLDAFVSLAKELTDAGVPHEMILYGGAPHAFTVFGGERYREEADHQSWARFLRFLAEKTK